MVLPYKMAFEGFESCGRLICLGFPESPPTGLASSLRHSLSWLSVHVPCLIKQTRGPTKISSRAASSGLPHFPYAVTLTKLG